MHIVTADPVSRWQIRQFAGHVRKVLDLENQRYFPILPVLEFVLPQMDPEFYIEIVPPIEMGDIYALTYPSRNLIRIREDVYDRAAAGYGRDRYTLAHELAHYLLHDDDRVALARAGADKKIPAFKDPEWQANAFAADILMPVALIKGLTVEQIVEECGVSRQAALIQMKQV